MRKSLGVALLLLSCASLSACSKGSFGTDVPPNTVLDEATPEDLNDLCVAISNELLALTEGPLARTVCTAFGVVLDSILVSCDDVRSACVDESVPPEVLACDNITAAAFDACDTTVAEVEDCMQQLRANVIRLENEVSCGMTRSELAMVEADNIYPELCTQIGLECPALGMLLQFDVELDPAADQ
jgi:hypothetical protein